MKVAVFGTRGIPNRYGGFEQFAEYLAMGLVQRGHDVTVYNSHSHTYKESEYEGVRIRHQFDPERWLGTFGQFVYDFNCIRDTRKRDYDIILQLGYASSAIWNPLFKKSMIVVTNMDGLEWKRSKYNKAVQQFLKLAELLTVKYNKYFVADSIGIQTYLDKKHQVESHYIPYGANSFNKPSEAVLRKYELQEGVYDMLVARFEPENNLEMILLGFLQANVNRTFVVVGNYGTAYGAYLRKKFSDNRIRFVGYVSSMDDLNSLRWYSNLYFHGHSVGGTNPSLLEAMASNALICAHNNEFNKAILEEDAFYFSTSEQVAHFVSTIAAADSEQFLIKNQEKIKTIYTWENIIDSYEKLFLSLLK